MSLLAPNPENYTLGRGVVFFDEFDANGNTCGAVDLGNTPSFAVTLDLTELDHFSSRSGIRKKDKTIITELTAGFNFTLDEVNITNLAMIFMAESNRVQQAQQAITAQTVEVKKENAYYFLPFRNVGNYVLPLLNITGTFQSGETVTGDTSAATATVNSLGTDRIGVGTVTGGLFQNGEVVTGGISSATATINHGTATVETDGRIFDQTDLHVVETATTLVRGTDYLIDGKSGRIKILSGTTGLTLDGTTPVTVTVTGEARAQNYYVMHTFRKNQVQGFVHFVSDVPCGTDIEYKAWRANIRPDGDVALIGEEFTTFSFTGEAQSDEANHPESPLADVIVIDRAA